MGYTTDFEGTVTFDRPLSKDIADYINRLNKTRRMRRDPAIIMKMDPDWKEHCLNGNLGDEGEFYTAPEQIKHKFVTEPAFFCRKAVETEPDPEAMTNNWGGQARDISVLDYNNPPKNQPGLWCQWCINDDGALEWDSGEKFYYYTEWLRYIIDNITKPAGYTANGRICWRGEEIEDEGVIIVENNEVTTHISNYLF